MTQIKRINNVIANLIKANQDIERMKNINWKIKYINEPSFEATVLEVF